MKTQFEVILDNFHYSIGNSFSVVAKMTEL